MINQAYPPKIIASVSDWEQWKSLQGKNLSDVCDWVELRVDGLPQELSAAEVMAYKPDMPILVTVRCPDEGGIAPIDDSTRFRLMENYLPYATALDIEIKHLEKTQELIQKAKARGVIIIASGHDFLQTPGEDYLHEQEKYARQLCADIVKFAYTLHSFTDIATGISLLHRRKGDVAVMGMGELGPISRLAYAQHGSCLIYGHLDGRATAPGQWPVALYRQALGNLSPINR